MSATDVKRELDVSWSKVGRVVTRVDWLQCRKRVRYGKTERRSRTKIR